MNETIREIFAKHYRTIRVYNYTLEKGSVIRTAYQFTLIAAIALGMITTWPLAIWILVAILHLFLAMADYILIQMSMSKILKALEDEDIYRSYDYVLWICDDMI